MAIVYLITNIENGKLYVGKTKGALQHRWYNHCREAAQGRGFALHAAIRKYGSASFNCKVLGEYPTEEEALIAERDWVLRLGTMGAKGYNLCEGGRGALGMVWTEERREKTLEAIRAPEAIAKMSQASRKAKSSSEFRAKVSAEAAARWEDPEMRAKQVAAQSAGQKVAHAARPERRVKSAAARRITIAKKRAERTHFDCKIHGRIPLSDCYEHKHGAKLSSFECKVCTLAKQKHLHCR
jgi:group I intron endonuclease